MERPCAPLQTLQAGSKTIGNAAIAASIDVVFCASSARMTEVIAKALGVIKPNGKAKFVAQAEIVIVAAMKSCACPERLHELAARLIAPLSTGAPNLRDPLACQGQQAARKS